MNRMSGTSITRISAVHAAKDCIYLMRYNESPIIELTPAVEAVIGPHLVKCARCYAYDATVQNKIKHFDWYKQRELAKQRPSDYAKLSPREQWDIDKALGILDWPGE